jgi:hypothetical protein
VRDQSLERSREIATLIVKTHELDGIGEYIAKIAFLIRARSVVQVHPGPPSKSPVNTRLFSLFPFPGIFVKNHFVNRLSTSGLAGCHYARGVPRPCNSHNQAARVRSSEITRPEEQKLYL